MLGLSYGLGLSWGLGLSYVCVTLLTTIDFLCSFITIVVVLDISKIEVAGMVPRCLPVGPVGKLWIPTPPPYWINVVPCRFRCVRSVLCMCDTFVNIGFVC